MKNRHLLMILAGLCALNVVFGIWAMAEEDANQTRVGVLKGELRELRTEADTRHHETAGEIRALRSELSGVRAELGSTRGELAEARSQLDGYRQIPWLNAENSRPPWAEDVADLRAGLEGVYEWLGWLVRFLPPTAPEEG